MPEDKKDKGLKDHTIVFMVVVALFYDVLGALLEPVAMYWLVSIFYFLTFLLWFGLHGINFWKPKRVLAMMTSFFIELIPIISILPAMTLAVLVVALDTKIKKILPAPIDKVISSTPRLKKAA